MNDEIINSIVIGIIILFVFGGFYFRNRLGWRFIAGILFMIALLFYIKLIEIITNFIESKLFDGIVIFAMVVMGFLIGHVADWMLKENEL